MTGRAQRVGLIMAAFTLLFVLGDVLARPDTLGFVPSLLLLSYPAGLVAGWACVRDKGVHRGWHRLAMALLLAQGALYVVLGARLVACDIAGATDGPGLPEALIVSSELAFFVVGPAGALLASLSTRRFVPMLVAQYVPLVFVGVLVTADRIV